MSLQYAILLFIVLLASTAVRNQAIPGGWTPIKDIDDPHVTDIANYAVIEHDKQTGLKLKLKKVISGETKIVNGIIYCLNISASDFNKYNVAVLERQQFRNLTSFVPISACVSKPKGLRRASSSDVVVYSEPPPPAESKSLFKPKPRTPSDIVRNTRDLLRLLQNSPDNTKRDNDKLIELFKNLRELKTILYGNSEAEPVPEACSQLTQEFFNDNTFRLLVQCLPKLNLEARKDATQVVANLQRQQVQSRLIASDYLEKNMDIMDILISSYDNPEMALHYGTMLRECIRHQIVAKYVLESPDMKKFFDYIQLPNFDIAADAAATFKELMTRHKSTVAEFLSKNYEWFFAEYNSKLLESSNYITRRQAVKLLGDMLLDRSNAAIMTRYVSSRENLRILMNLMRESSKSIQIEAFHVFKLFAANQRKPPDIIGILVANRSKLLRLLGELKIDKEDEQFEADKAQVMKEVAALEPRE